VRRDVGWAKTRLLRVVPTISPLTLRSMVGTSTDSASALARRLCPPYRPIARRAVCAGLPCENCPSCQSVAVTYCCFSEFNLTTSPNRVHDPCRPALDKEQLCWK
jgi:hypothetical protein